MITCVHEAVQVVMILDHRWRSVRYLFRGGELHSCPENAAGTSSTCFLCNPFGCFLVFFSLPAYLVFTCLGCPSWEPCHWCWCHWCHMFANMAIQILHFSAYCFDKRFDSLTSCLLCGCVMWKRCLFVVAWQTGGTWSFICLMKCHWVFLPYRVA
jgi:hypothetical protein